MTRVILAGKDWQSRALVRAQLIEEGVEVEAHDSVGGAVQSLESSELLPGLFVADLAGCDDADLALLAQWAAQIPVWAIAGRSQIAAKDLKGRNFEMTLFRPVDVGELVEQIKRRVEEA